MKNIWLHESLVLFPWLSYHHFPGYTCFKFVPAAAAAKSLQSCPTLCDPMDCSLPGFSVHGILQARTLEWVAISFSNAWRWKVKVKLLSRVWLLATPWTAAYQAPPSMGFSGQQYWSGVPVPSPKLFLNGFNSEPGGPMCIREQFVHLGKEERAQGKEQLYKKEKYI